MVIYQPVQDGTDVAKISPEKRQVIKKLWLVVLLSFAFMIIQALGGYFANSLAVMSDAAHLFSDVVGYAMSLLAVVVSTWKPTPQMTFGYGRAEILGAFLSVLFLWLVLYHLVIEAIERLSDPESVDGPVMFAVSLTGLCVNLLMGFVLLYSGHGHSHGLRKCEHSHGDDGCSHDCTQSQECSHSHGCTHSHDHSCGHKGCKDLELGLGSTSVQCVPAGTPKSEFSDVELGPADSEKDQHCSDEHHTNMNIRAAVIHIIADTFQAVGVVISSGLIWYDPHRFALADPICTLVFSVVGFGCSLNIMNDIFNIFMLRTPTTIDVAELQKTIFDLDARIINVDNIRIWSLTMSDTVMTCDVRTRSSSLNTPSFIQSIKDAARKFGITEVTCCVENMRTDEKGPFVPKLKFGKTSFKLEFGAKV